MIDLSTGKITLKKFLDGRYVNGHWVDGKHESVEISVSVQPMKPNEMLLLPEGRRNIGGIKIYSETELKAADEKAGINADVITYDGKLYEVLMVWDWTRTDIPHYKVFAVKIDGEGA